jgi:hypothetical protein
MIAPTRVQRTGLLVVLTALACFALGRVFRLW